MSLKDKIVKRGEEVFTKVVEKAISKTPKDKQAAMLAKSARKLICFVGVEEMRRRVIAGVEDDFRKKLEANPDATLEELIREYLDEPEAMALFEDLEMGEDHLRVMAKNIIAEKAKGRRDG